MAGKDRSTKDKAMASNLKKKGIRRSTVRCPICYTMFPEGRFPNHIATVCKGQR
jgi:hypothetical protein